MRITEVTERDLACPSCGRHDFSGITDATAWCTACCAEVRRADLVPSRIPVVRQEATGGPTKRFGTLRHPLGRAERVAVEVFRLDCLGERATLATLHRRLRDLYAPAAIDQAAWWLVDRDILAVECAVDADPDRPVWFAIRPHRRFDLGRLHAHDEGVVAEIRAPPVPTPSRDASF
jgi:hypothetical protein